MRRTKIVATLGPATDDPGVLDAVIKGGLDIARLNAAHSELPELALRLASVRAAEERCGVTIGVLLDLPGPKLRLGNIASGTLLVAGETFVLHAGECDGDAAGACVSYGGLAEDLARGGVVALDDGRLELVVTGFDGRDVLTRVTLGGPLSSHKGVNVPGVTIGVEPISGRDRSLLEWAQEADIDYVAQSFVRSADDVEELRGLMTVRGIPIVAKIEKHEAVGRIDSIVAAADAVMVARGDLGVETSPEIVPVVQRRIIAAARAAGKPVVVATQMLESMTTSPRPTRAEASDVANAIFSRVDACMLSAETSVGRYPVETVETMARIAATAEEALIHAGWDHGGVVTTDVQAAVSAAVCDLASDLCLAAIVPLTQSGTTALAVARHRPDAPIVAVTPTPGVARQLALVWGVRPLVIAFAQDTDTLLDSALAAVREAGLAAPGEQVALTAGRMTRSRGGTDFILVSEV
jgi:pyruvate kinase